MRMNTRLEIQQRVGGDDWTADEGQWERVCDVFASVRPLSGREYVDTRQVVATVTHKLRFHYVAGITPGMRGVDGLGRVFCFESVVNLLDRNRTIEATATEVV